MMTNMFLVYKDLCDAQSITLFVFLTIQNTESDF